MQWWGHLEAAVRAHDKFSPAGKFLIFFLKIARRQTQVLHRNAEIINMLIKYFSAFFLAYILIFATISANAHLLWQ